MKLFERFDFPTDFFQQIQQNGTTNENYRKGISVLNRVKVVNDVSRTK